MLRLTLIALVAMLMPVLVLAEEAAVENQQNTVCGAGISAGKFKLSEIGPKVAGTWQATAPGLGYTQGVQEFDVVISFERGRLYIGGGGGPKVELKPVYGTRKALRYDPIRQKALPESAHAAKLSLEDIELVTACNPGIAAQFTWTYGMGGNSSGGIYSFLGEHVALGTMWNNRQGAREVLLQR